MNTLPSRRLSIEALERRRLLAVVNPWQHDGQEASTVYCETDERVDVDLVVDGQVIEGRGAGHSHLFHVAGLTPGREYQARFVEEGVETGQAVTLRPEVYADSTPIDGPATIDAPGHYHLTGDVISDGTGLTVTASDVTLDLNGHSILYGNGDNTSYAAYGIHGPAWNRSGLTVVNGTIAEGTPDRASYGMYFVAMRGLEIGGVSIHYAGDDAMAAVVRDGHQGHFHHNEVFDTGTGITNRHVGLTAVAFLGRDLTAEHNFIHTRHRAFNVQGGDTIRNNEVSIDSWATNAGAVLAYGKSDVSVNDNWIYGTGEHVVAISFTGGGSDSQAVGNYIQLDLVGPIDRSGEYGNRAGGVGLRTKDDSHDLLFSDNTIVVNATGKAYGRATWLATGPNNTNVVVEDSHFTVNLHDVIDPGYVLPRTGVVSVIGNPNNPRPHAPAVYRNLVLESNICHVMLGEPYGIGQDSRFEDVTMVRLPGNPDYHTIRSSYTSYSSNGHEFVGTQFAGGAGFSDTLWIGTGDNSYTVVEPDGTRVLVDRQNPYPGGPPPNTPPTAVLQAPGTVLADEVFRLDASGSHDAETAALEARFDVDGDGQFDTGWGGLAVDHAFAEAGSYQPVVEVRDGGGLTDRASVAVTVEAPPQNTPPTAVLDGPAEAETGETVTLDAAGSFDAEDPTADLSMRWDFDGDGQWDTAWATAGAVEHVFAAAGDYRVVLEIRDTGGLSSTAERTIAVSDPVVGGDPVAELAVNHTTLRRGEQIVLDARGSYDPGGQDLVYRWDVNGDGRWDIGWQPEWSTVDYIAGRVWARGSFLMTLQVRNEDGLVAEDSVWVTVV